MRSLHVELERATSWTQRGKSIGVDMLVSTDPPYYDNIGYADLSDFFYVWLRRSLKGVFPELFCHRKPYPKLRNWSPRPTGMGTSNWRRLSFSKG